MADPPGSPARRKRPQGSRLTYVPGDTDAVDNRAGLRELILGRLAALNRSQSEAARLGGTAPDGKKNITRSTVSRLASKGLSPPLDGVTIKGLAQGLEVSQAEVMRAVVVTLGLGKALPDTPPDLADLLLRVSDLEPELREMWLDLAAATATVLSHREAGVRSPVHAATTTRRTGGGGRAGSRNRGFVRDDGSVSGEPPDLSAEDQAQLDAAERQGQQQWGEEHGH